MTEATRASAEVQDPARTTLLAHLARDRFEALGAQTGPETRLSFAPAGELARSAGRDRLLRALEAGCG